MDIGVQSDSSSDSSSSSSSNTSSSDESDSEEEEEDEKLFKPSSKKIDTLTAKENEVKQHHLTESNKLKHDLTTNIHNGHENDYSAKKYTLTLNPF